VRLHPAHRVVVRPSQHVVVDAGGARRLRVDIGEAVVLHARCSPASRPSPRRAYGWPLAGSAAATSYSWSNSPYSWSNSPYSWSNSPFFTLAVKARQAPGVTARTGPGRSLESRTPTAPGRPPVTS